MANQRKPADRARTKQVAAPNLVLKQAFVPGTAWTNGRARHYFGVADPVADIAFLVIALTLAVSAAIAAL